MLNRTLILLIAGAKALTVAVTLMLSTGAAAANDCVICAPPPDCYPDEPCWGEC